MLEHSKDNVYGSGLCEKDWHILKDLVLSVNFGALNEVKVPSHLENHIVVTYVNDFLEGQKSSLNKAMKALVPIDPEHAFIALAKS